MDLAIKRLAQRILAKTPDTYLRSLQLIRRGSFEKRLYLSLIRKGNVVVEAAAHTGHFTRLFSDLVGATGTVHGFEPVPETFGLLTRNLRRRPAYKNLELVCAALG